MYVHRRCKPSEAALNLDRTTHGYCGICGNQGTIYLVKGTEDSYRHKRQGVTYTVTAVGTLTDEEVAIAEAKTNTTDTPVIVPPEAELTEEIAPLAEVQEEAVEAVIDEAAEIEKEPEETPLEAEPEPLGVVEPSDAKIDDPIPEGVEVVGGDPRITAKVLSELEEARKATIARLEAELAKLKN